MALHTLMYYGYFDRCRPLLRADQTKYWTKPEDPTVDAGKRVEMPPSEFTGIRFGQMQRGYGRFAIVKVDAIILTVAVEHDADRHGDVPDKEWVELTDDHAANLLVDAIVANHLLRDALALKIRGLESPTPKST